MMELYVFSWDCEMNLKVVRYIVQKNKDKKLSQLTSVKTVFK